jgi:signal transduction histidine kinase
LDRHGYILVSLRILEDPAHPDSPIEEVPKSVIRLTVQDTGQGISPEYLRTRIFQPFAQENNKSAGTGLGLSIVRSLVNMLEGDIDIKSILNTGTIAIVTLRT